MPLLCATRVNNASKYIYPWVPHGSISGKKPYRIKNYDCISATTIRNPIPLFDICTNTGSKEKDIMSEYYLSLPRSASGFYLHGGRGCRSPLLAHCLTCQWWWDCGWGRSVCCSLPQSLSDHTPTCCDIKIKILKRPSVSKSNAGMLR